MFEIANSLSQNISLYNSIKNYNLILMNCDNNKQSPNSSNKGDEFFIDISEKIRKEKKENKCNKLFIYQSQRILNDNNEFIKHSYYGNDFYKIYQFFQDVIRSPLLKYIYSNIDGYSLIINKYDFSDITLEKITNGYN